MACFDLLFDLEGEVAGAQIYYVNKAASPTHQDFKVGLFLAPPRQKKTTHHLFQTWKLVDMVPSFSMIAQVG